MTLLTAPRDAVPMHPLYGADVSTRPETASEADEKAARHPDHGWRFWMKELKSAQAIEKRWRDEADQAERLYYGDDEPMIAAGKAAQADETHIAHATIDTLRPVIYSQPPDPIVRRRFQGDGEDDPVDRFVAEVAQRVLAFLIDRTDYDYCMMTARDDWLVPGRGCVRLVYEAEIAEEPDPKVIDMTGRPVMRDVVKSEQVYPRYWPWRDVVISPAASWQDVRWIAYRHYWAREDAEDQGVDPKIISEMAFHVAGEETTGQDQSNSSEFSDDDDYPISGDPRPRAVVWEIWFKKKRKVIWISEGWDRGYIKEEEDPLALEDFWDMPRPLFASTRGQTMTPRPDLVYYASHIDAINLATKRLNSVMKMLRAVGFYPGAKDELLAKALDGGDHKLIAVKAWTAFVQNGGSRELIQWLPIDMFAGVAQHLVVMIATKKQDLFEISGVSDIMRGQGDPSETATAQRIKGRYAGLRVSDRQRRMALFCRDSLRIMLEIAVEHFDESTIAAMTQIDLPWTEAERAARSRVVLGENGQPTQADPAFVDKGASWESVMERLRSDLSRAYSVSIETDSTVLEDEQEDREARVAFITAFQGFVAGMAPIVAQVPDSWPLVKGVLLFGVRGFRKARMLENLVEDLPDKMPAQQVDRGPSPEEIKLKISELQAALEREIHSEKLRHESAEAAKDREHELRKIGVKTKADAIKLAHEDARKDEDREIDEVRSGRDRAREDIRRQEDREDRRRDEEIAT